MHHLPLQKALVLTVTLRQREAKLEGAHLSDEPSSRLQGHASQYEVPVHASIGSQAVIVSRLSMK